MARSGLLLMLLFFLVFQSLLVSGIQLLGSIFIDFSVIQLKLLFILVLFSLKLPAIWCCASENKPLLQRK